MEKSRIVVTKAWTGAGGKGLVLLPGSEFQFGMMPAFRRWWRRLHSNVRNLTPVSCMLKDA